jgi:hypothetical protein
LGNQSKSLQGRASKQRYKERKLEVYSLLGGRCVDCHETDERVLQIDHRYSDGNKERKFTRSQLYSRVRKNTNRYQLLCANCNWRKRTKDMVVQSRDNVWWRTKSKVATSIILASFITALGAYVYYD